MVLLKTGYLINRGDTHKKPNPNTFRGSFWFPCYQGTHYLNCRAMAGLQWEPTYACVTATCDIVPHSLDYTATREHKVPWHHRWRQWTTIQLFWCWQFYSCCNAGNRRTQSTSKKPDIYPPFLKIRAHPFHLSVCVFLAHQSPGYARHTSQLRDKHTYFWGTAVN